MDFCKIPEQPSQDTQSNVPCVLCIDAQYSHILEALSTEMERSVLGATILPHYLWGWEHPILHPEEVSVEKVEYIFACFPSRCYRRVSVQQLTLLRIPQLTLFPTSLTGLWHFSFSGSTSRSDANPMLCFPLWTAPMVQDPTVLWPFLAHQPLGWAVICPEKAACDPYPGNHAQGFFQKLCQSSLHRYHTLRVSKSLKLSENI